jgi:predicted DNA-binding protein (UPF0251 family)
MRKLSYLLLAACAAGCLNAQESPELKQVVDRLDRLEAQNRELMTEIKALRQQLAANQQPAPLSDAATRTEASAQIEPAAQPVAERVAVIEQRMADLDQSKIGSDHRLPVRLTGMLLFNTFLNGKGAGGADNPTVLSPTAAQASGGGTFRQSVIGLKVDGPNLVGGGKVTGAIYMDFFGGGTGLNQTMRLRVAKLDATWKNTTLGFAFDKPIIAPREPDSMGKARLALQRLDEKLRIPLILKEVEEMSVEEIAKTMGLTQTNVKVRLFRARKKLQSMLGGTEGRNK